jgi:hypothetical protein
MVESESRFGHMSAKFFGVVLGLSTVLGTCIGAYGYHALVTGDLRRHLDEKAAEVKRLQEELASGGENGSDELRQCREAAANMEQLVSQKDARITRLQEEIERLSSNPGERVGAPDSSDDSGSSELVATSRNFEFQLSGCDRQGSEIVCRLKIENQGVERELGLFDGSIIYDGGTKMTTEDGDVVAARAIEIGGNRGGYFTHQMVRGVPTKAAIFFPDPGVSGKRISLIVLQATSDQGIFPVQFRNIPVD